MYASKTIPKKHDAIQGIIRQSLWLNCRNQVSGIRQSPAGTKSSDTYLMHIYSVYENGVSKQIDTSFHNLKPAKLPKVKPSLTDLARKSVNSERYGNELTQESIV
ncbi:hypothetical protein ACTXT7_001913 [Hymenolepis weldensis]